MIKLYVYNKIVKKLLQKLKYYKSLYIFFLKHAIFPIFYMYTVYK